MLAQHVRTIALDVAAAISANVIASTAFKVLIAQKVSTEQFYFYFYFIPFELIQFRCCFLFAARENFRSNLVLGSNKIKFETS